MNEWNNARFDRSLPRLNTRAQTAATFIEPNSAVLDVGCGHRLIRPFLPESVRYFGIDKNPIAPDVAVFDLDKHEFPDGSWDYIVMLGTLAWIEERQWALATAKERAPKLVTSRPGSGPNTALVNSWLEQAGWRIVDIRPIPAPDRKSVPEALLCARD